MKKKILLLTALFASAILLTTTGCNKSDTSVDPTSSESTYATIIPDVQSYSSDITDATVDNEMALKSNFEENQAYAECQNFKHGQKPGKGDRREDFISFRGIFQEMALTDTQKNAIHDYMIAYRDCVHDALVILRGTEKAIIQAGNAQIKEIKDSLKAGVITKLEAKALIQEINAQVRNDLQNNPAKEVFKAAVCDCLTTLIANIESGLTEEQLAIFQAWLVEIEHPCLVNGE